MAEKIVRQILCDACMGADPVTERAADTSITISLERGAPRSVDLCDEHGKNMRVSALLMLAAESGRPPMTEDEWADAASALVSAPEYRYAPGPNHRPRMRGHRRQPMAAPRNERHYCFLCWRSFLTAEGPRSHYVRAHGAPNPLAPGAFIADPHCPLCPDASFTSVNGLGRHTADVHELTTSGAFKAAHDQGDRYGVVANLRTLEQAIAAAATPAPVPGTVAGMAAAS